MNYQIDFGTISSSSAPIAGDLPLYASIDGRAAALGGDEVVFYDPAQDRNHVMTASVLQALDLCRPFQTLDAHVQRVCESISSLKGQAPAVKRVLEGLAARGLLVSDDAFALGLVQAVETKLAPVAGMFVRACDRPDQLKTLLLSLRENRECHGGAEPVVVVDDSREAGAVDAHAQMLADFATAAPCAVHHVSPARWSAVVDQLERAAPSVAAGRALRAMVQRDPRYRGRFGGGIGKNLITLLAAGMRYLLLDDDFAFPLRRHPQPSDELALGDRAWGVRTFSSHDAALAAGTEADAVDPLALHLDVCGRRLGEVINQNRRLTLGRDQLRGFAPSRDALLAANAHILMTMNGHRGGSGASSLAWAFLLDPMGRSGYAGDEQTYLALRGDPPVWFGCSRYRLARCGNFTPFAIDNSRMMPCTSPFGRGEDAVFSALVALSYKNAVQLDLPWSIGHRPESGRDRSVLLGQAEAPDINHCLSELIGHVAGDLYASDLAPRYAVMAAKLEDLAGGSDAGVSAYLREYLAYRRSALVEQLQRIAAASTNAPQAWQRDLTTLIEANGRAILDRGAPRFAGWPADATSAECAAAFRRETGVLAAGLRAWSAAWQIACAQRESWLGAARVG